MDPSDAIVGRHEVGIAMHFVVCFGGVQSVIGLLKTTSGETEENTSRSMLGLPHK